MSVTKQNAVDASKFEAVTFFSLSCPCWSARAQVRNPASYLQYIKQYVDEATAKAQELGLPIREVLAASHVAVDIEDSLLNTILANGIGGPSAQEQADGKAKKKGKKAKMPTITKPLFSSEPFDETLTT